ncbi:hypothetical protein JW711_04815 [Candidatus Woesearchaeota archaeon]|nr:hypothetical protein [Candidatus Woesearchaeota archaeon]
MEGNITEYRILLDNDPMKGIRAKLPILGTRVEVEYDQLLERSSEPPTLDCRLTADTQEFRPVGICLRSLAPASKEWHHTANQDGYEHIERIGTGHIMRYIIYFRPKKD